MRAAGLCSVLGLTRVDASFVNCKTCKADVDLELRWRRCPGRCCGWGLVRRRRIKRLMDVVDVDLNGHDKRESKSHSFDHRTREMRLSSSSLGGHHPQALAICQAHRLGLNDPWSPAIATSAAPEFFRRRDIKRSENMSIYADCMASICFLGQSAGDQGRAVFQTVQMLRYRRKSASKATSVPRVSWRYTGRCKSVRGRRRVLFGIGISGHSAPKIVVFYRALFCLGSSTTPSTGLFDGV